MKACFGVYGVVFLAIVWHYYPSRTDPPEAIHFQPTPEAQDFYNVAFDTQQARGTDEPGGTGFEASRALLAEIKGLPIHRSSHAEYWRPASYTTVPAPRAEVNARPGNCIAIGDSAWNAQEIGRRFLPCNGASAYIDLNHLELCLPETIGAFDHVAAWHGLLRLARGALERANQGRPADRRIKVLVNNSDGEMRNW